MAEKRSSMQSRIRGQLRDEITSGQMPVGERLPSVRKLADHFDTSIYTVQKAVGLLEEEGYVRVKNGIGTFISDTTPRFNLSNTVALCMRPGAHLHGPLSMKITNRLLEHHISPMLVNVDQRDSDRMIQSMARAEVNLFAIHGHGNCPFELFESPLLKDKWLLALLEWFGPEHQRLLRVLSDDEAGGRAVARHLWERGHRRAVYVATDSAHALLEEQKNPAWGNRPRTRLKGFVDEWIRRGGKVSGLHSHIGAGGYDVWIDENEFRRAFSPKPPSAVFGFRDVEAVRMQQGIREWMPELENEVDIVGYFDTPWSRAADPPISTVSLRLDAIAERTAEMVEAALVKGKVEKRTRTVRPQLIVRQDGTGRMTDDRS